MSDIFDHACDASEREEAGQVARQVVKHYGIASSPVSTCVQTREPRPAYCKRCGREGLHWALDHGRYRLFGSDGLQHVCEITANGVDRIEFYGVVDRLDDGELGELMHYCEQELIRRKG